MCVYLASDSRFLIFPYFFSFNFCQETSCVKKFLAKKLPGSLASALKFFLISTPEFFLSGFCILIGNVQFSHSVVSDSLQPHEPQHARPPCPLPTPVVHPTMSIEVVMPSSHLILCRPLLLQSSIFPSIRVFSNESVLCIRWPKYWSFSFNISTSNEHQD